MYRFLFVMLVLSAPLGLVFSGQTDLFGSSGDIHGARIEQETVWESKTAERLIGTWKFRYAGGQEENWAFAANGEATRAEWTGRWKLNGTTLVVTKKAGRFVFQTSRTTTWYGVLKEAGGCVDLRMTKRACGNQD